MTKDVWLRGQAFTRAEVAAALGEANKLTPGVRVRQNDGGGKMNDGGSKVYFVLGGWLGDIVSKASCPLLPTETRITDGDWTWVATTTDLVLVV